MSGGTLDTPHYESRAAGQLFWSDGNRIEHVTTYSFAATLLDLFVKSLDLFFQGCRRIGSMRMEDVDPNSVLAYQAPSITITNFLTPSGLWRRCKLA